MEVEAFQDGYLSGPLARGRHRSAGRSKLSAISPTVRPKLRPVPKPRPNWQQPRGRSPATALPRRRRPPRQGRCPRFLAASMASLRSAPPRGAPARHEPPAAPAASAQAPARSSPATPVMAALDAGPPYRMEQLSSMREAMARNMIASLATPTFRVTAQFQIKALKDAADKKQLSLTLLLARACALTVKAMPIFNAVYTPERTGAARPRRRRHRRRSAGRSDHAGAARRRGAVRWPKLAEDWKALREQSRETPARRRQEYSGATFYVSNLGMFVDRAQFRRGGAGRRGRILCIGAGKDGGFVHCDLRSPRRLWCRRRSVS